MINIAVASGKGGTGKTTVSVNLARAIGCEVVLLDCDVEEPNDHLFLKGNALGSEVATVLVPKVDNSLCNGCGECGRFCEFHAIVPIGNNPLIFPEMCHSCGGCVKVCPQKAISEESRRIGVIETTQSENIKLIQGRIDVSVAMSPPLIYAVKKHLVHSNLTIIDAPPGTSCPVIAAFRDSDIVLLVTEPTPFGLHDLKLAVDVVREINIPFGVIVNRMGVGDSRVHIFCQEERIPVLIEIPDDRRIAEAYSKGELTVDA